MSDIIINSDKSGNSLFESKIKNKTIYNQIPSPYRVYNTDGLKYIQKVTLKNTILKQIL
jgi:hypothetical protein